MFTLTIAVSANKKLSWHGKRKERMEKYVYTMNELANNYSAHNMQ